jgi:hypothetical protein
MDRSSSKSQSNCRGPLPLGACLRSCLRSSRAFRPGSRGVLPRNAPKRTEIIQEKNNILGLVGSSKVNQIYVGVRHLFFECPLVLLPLLRGTVQNTAATGPWLMGSSFCVWSADQGTLAPVPTSCATSTTIASRLGLRALNDGARPAFRSERPQATGSHLTPHWTTDVLRLSRSGSWQRPHELGADPACWQGECECPPVPPKTPTQCV